MHEWVNEDQKMMVRTLVLESEAVPPRTRLGIVCCEISVMVRQMTRRTFWRVVMSDVAHLNRLVLQKTPGPAEPANTGIAGMAARVRAAAAATADC